MSERPQYRALGRIVLPAAGPVGARTIEAGAEFFYDGAPHFGMVPVTAAGRTAKLKSIDLHHWREARRPEQINRLAKSLGFVGTDSAAARTFIEVFIKTEIQKESTP
jgi:hypothetical protein